MVKNKTKTKVGASFFALTFFMLITKNAYFFCCYVFAVFLHEVSHGKMANKLGYKTNHIKLSAFGGVLYGSFEDTSCADEVKIALAGPICNLCLAVVTLACWWLYPECYVFTQPFYMANLCVFFVNLLPCYPLDGGRVLFALLNNKFGNKMSKKIFGVFGIVLSLCFFALFVFTVFSKETNLTFGLFGLFLFSNATNMSNIKIYSRVVGLNISNKKLQKGIEVKTVAISQSNTVASLAKYCCGSCLYNVQVVDEACQVVAMLGFDELQQILLAYPLDTKLKQIDDIPPKLI